MYIDEQSESETRTHLAELRLQHRLLDEAIEQLTAEGFEHVDQLQLRRMKKHKLQLKDTIARLESMLIPDLDA